MNICLPIKVKEDEEVQEAREHLVQDSPMDEDLNINLEEINEGCIPGKGPRRPLSPYIFFSQLKRKDLKKEHPDWNSS
jgi:hypothetical protein